MLSVRRLFDRVSRQPLPSFDANSRTVNGQVVLFCTVSRERLLLRWRWPPNGHTQKVFRPENMIANKNESIRSVSPLPPAVLIEAGEAAKRAVEYVLRAGDSQEIECRCGK